MTDTKPIWKSATDEDVSRYRELLEKERSHRFIWSDYTIGPLIARIDKEKARTKNREQFAELQKQMKESLDNQLVGVKWKLAQADKRVRQLRVLGQQFLDDVTKAMDWNTHDHTSGSGPDFQTALKEKDEQ